MFFIYFEEINNMNYNKSLLSILIIAIMLCIGISPKGAEERLFKKDGKEKKQIVVEEGSESEGEEGSEFEEEPTAKRQLTKNKTAAQKRIEAAKKRKEEAAKSRSQKKMTVEKGTSAKKQPTKNKTAAQKRIEAAKKRKEEAAKSRSQKKMTVEKGTSAKKQPTKNKTAAQKRIEAAKKRKEEVAKSRGQKTTGKTTTTVSQKNIQKLKVIVDQCKQNILKKLSALNDQASQSVGNELWERSMGNGEKNDFIACLAKNLPKKETLTEEEVKAAESFAEKTSNDIYEEFLKKGFNEIKKPNPEKKPEPESSNEESSEEGSESSEEGEEFSEEGGGESEETTKKKAEFMLRLQSIHDSILSDYIPAFISKTIKFQDFIAGLEGTFNVLWKYAKDIGLTNTDDFVAYQLLNVIDKIEKALEDKDIKTATGEKVKISTDIKTATGEKVKISAPW